MLGPHESTDTDIQTLHAGNLDINIGTIVEVLTGHNEFSYGTITGKSGANLLVTYLDRDEDNIHSFQEDSYEAPKESINRFVSFEKGQKAAAWKMMGFVYLGRHEIVPIEDYNTESSDEDWDPEDEDQSEESEQTDDTDDSEDSIDEDEQEGKGE